MRPSSFLAVSALLARQCLSYTIPTNLQTFYNAVVAQGSCSYKLKSGFYAKDSGSASFSYCGDHLQDYGIVYLQGTGGALADMDVDCDGVQHGVGSDDRCDSSDDTQSQTSFQDTVAGYDQDITDLNPFIHTYVVFGNSGSNPGYTTFNPTLYGIQPLSVIAVVCNGQLHYGIWGDENGDDDPVAMIGEASISMATLCFGSSMTGGNGHDQTDVLYIAFNTSDAVPGALGASWSATTPSGFENSIKSLGDTLVSRIGGGGNGGGSTTTTPTPTPTCSWAGHCAGASCSSDNDCSDDLVCSNGHCASSSSGSNACASDSCSWSGHCAGASCSSSSQCDGDLVCKSGKCSNSDCTWGGHCICASCSSDDDCADDLSCTDGKCQ